MDIEDRTHTGSKGKIVLIVCSLYVLWERGKISANIPLLTFRYFLGTNDVTKRVNVTMHRNSCKIDLAKQNL